MRIEGRDNNKRFDESDASYEARQLWYSFKDIVLQSNRFYVKHPLLDVLSHYLEEAPLSIATGLVFYRARIIDDTCVHDSMMYKCYGAPDQERSKIGYFRKNNSFRGLTKEASFIPPKSVKVPEGRANPRYIRYLYVSEDPTTALFEVRPFIFDAVNIARIEVKDELKIANIAVNLDINDSEDAPIEVFVMHMIQGAFSRPTNNPDDYLPTQVITEYIKSLGYEGLRYNSSLRRSGVNLTIFNYEKCEAVSSQDFRIEDIKITARAAMGSADYQGDLFYIKDNEPLFLDNGQLRSAKL